MTTTTTKKTQKGKPAGGAIQRAENHAPVPYHANAPLQEPGLLKGLLERREFKQAMRKAAPRHISVERLTRMAITAVSRQPMLLRCTQASILKGLMESAILGLDCSGLLARGYLVPFKNGRLSREMRRDVYEAVFIPGYLGLCDLARRSGEIDYIKAVAVFEGDEFEYEEGLEQRLVHRPNASPDARKDKEHLRYVYAVVAYRTGAKDFRVMTMAEVESHRQRSRAKDNGPWVTDYIPMSLKTVCKALCKWLPLSPEMADALAREAEAEGDADADAIWVDADAGQSRNEQVAAMLGSNGAPPLPAEEADPATQSEAARQVEALKGEDAALTDAERQALQSPTPPPATPPPPPAANAQEKSDDELPDLFGDE